MSNSNGVYHSAYGNFEQLLGIYAYWLIGIAKTTITL